MASDTGTARFSWSRARFLVWEEALSEVQSLPRTSLAMLIDNFAFSCKRSRPRRCWRSSKSLERRSSGTSLVLPARIPLNLWQSLESFEADAKIRMGLHLEEDVEKKGGCSIEKGMCLKVGGRAGSFEVGIDSTYLETLSKAKVRGEEELVDQP